MNTSEARYRVYVLQNTSGRFYIGISEDVARRVEQHNSGVSTWTRSRGPWTLLWTSSLITLTEARKLENTLKRQKGLVGFYKLTGLTRQGS